MRRKRGGGVLQGLLTLLPVPLVALLASVGVASSSAADHRADRAEAAARGVELQAEVWRLSRAQLRETNLVALVALGHDDLADEAATAQRERIGAREQTLDRLAELAAGSDEVADDAASVIETIEAEDVGTGTVPPHRLWDALMAIQSSATDGGSDRPDVAVIGDLGEVAQISWYVASDVIDAEYTRTRPTVPGFAREYFQRSVDYIESGQAGWLAAAGDPFSGQWVPRASVRRLLPEVESALDDVFATRAARVLVALDDWVKDADDPPVAPPPVTVGELMGLADEVGADLTAVGEEAVTVETARHEQAAASARARQDLLLVGSGLLVIGTAAGLTLVLRRRRVRISALEEAAETDGLTGLANRRAIQRRVPPRLADPERAGHVVIQVDLDRFKAVNDAYGHRVGDELLLAFAGRTDGLLRRRFGDHDREVEFARVGGDEFLVVLHDSPDPRREADELVAEIEDLFRTPIACGPVRIRVDLSGGIAVATVPTDLDRLLLEADIALYQAKATRHSSFEAFDDPALRDIMRDFPSRMAAGAVRVDLQPQVDLVTGAVEGFEALARWSADGEKVPAAVWVKAVEQLGGADLLFAAVSRSVGEAAEHLGAGFAGRFWINLSPLQLGESGSAERLLGHLAGAGLDPDRVGIEVIETAAFSDLGMASQNLEELRLAGVSVALDDFGSGFTPLGHLTALPVDLLKLDRSVVAALDRRPRQAALVEAMVAIADKLDMALIAEGIETEAERDTLVSLGVRCGQGYLLGHPAPVEVAAGHLVRAVV